MSEAKHQSGLLRGLTMRRTSNKLAIAGFGVAVVLLVARAVSEQWIVGEPMTVPQAFASSVAVFAAWAIARELDPDHPWPAAVSMVATFVVALWFLPLVLAVITAGAVVRMVGGTVARPLGLIDLGVLAVVGFASGHDLSMWSIAIVAFVFLKVAPEVGSLRWWAVGTLIVGFVVGWYTGELNPIIVTAQTVAATAGFLAVAAIASLRVKVSVKTDARTGQVQPMRIAMSRLAAGVVVASATLLGGLDTAWSLAAIWTPLIIVAIVSLIPFLAGPTSDGLPPRSAGISDGTQEEPSDDPV
jgi:hypothetical protein